LNRVHHKDYHAMQLGVTVIVGYFEHERYLN
jgi:hypothetical protein